MSKYNDFKTQFKDPKILCEALKTVGIKEIELHETPQQLMGYQGDYRQDTAEVIIRRKFVGSASNDIGFKRQSDGTYAAIISEFDRHSHNYNETWLKQLADIYAEKKTINIAVKQGLKVIKREMKNGAVVLQLLKQ